VTLSENFKELISQQESLEAQRTRVLLLMECFKPGDKKQFEDALLLLQMILASQVTIAKGLLVECASVTCEFVEWPLDLRA
jgi:hypothetical protein